MARNTFENKTARWIEMFGKNTRPEGDLVHVSLSASNHVWAIFVVLTPAGDQRMILTHHNDTVLSFFPDLITARMFPLDADRSTFQKLPTYVKARINELSEYAVRKSL